MTIAHSQMNLYLVVSEMLTEVVCEDDSVNACHEEDYCIEELVVAHNRSQAKYIAWKSDPDSYEENYSILEMPKFSVKLKRKDVGGKPRIASGEFASDDSAWGNIEEGVEE